MSDRRAIHYARSSHRKIRYESQILFEEQVIFTDEQTGSKPVVLQLMNDALIIRPIDSTPRQVVVLRDSKTHSLGFSIKGGKDTGKREIHSTVFSSNFLLSGFPVFISRLQKSNVNLLNLGDVILAINHEDISSLTHQQVISKLHQITNKKISLTVQFRNDLAKYFDIQKYSLLYARVNQHFEVVMFDGRRIGRFQTKTIVQQNMWISRINLVCRHLIRRKLNQLNQNLLSNEQVLYANWIYERTNGSNEWKPVFLVFKDTHLYIFGDDQTPPFTIPEFVSCRRVYSILEIFIEILTRYPQSFIFTFPFNQTHYLNFERQSDYDDFISNYQRSLYISVYSIRIRIFNCVYQGQTCRFMISIHDGFIMYSKTNKILWKYPFEQLQSSMDNGRNEIYFEFQSNFVDLQVQNQDLPVLVNVINAFLTVKYLGREEKFLLN